MFTGNPSLTRSSYSLDIARLTLAAPIRFLAPGSGKVGALLRAYSPPQGGVAPTNLGDSPGSFVDAGPLGTEGIVAVYANGAGYGGASAGDYVVVLTGGVQRAKRASMTVMDPESTSPLATTMRMLTGDIASAAPNLTSYYRHMLASGVGTNVTATGATQTVATFASAPGFAAHVFAGMTFTILTDVTQTGNVGLSATISDNSTTVLTLEGGNAAQIATESSNATTTWQITSGGTVIATGVNYAINISFTAYANATWLDSAATWNTNEFAGQQLIDSVGNTYKIVSNTNDGGAGTATLTLAYVDLTQNPEYIDPTGGAYQIAALTEQGQSMTIVSGTTSSSGSGTFTPTFAANDGMYAGQFAGMILTTFNPTVINAAGGTGAYDQWFITDNSTTVMDVVPYNVAPAASQTTPTAATAWTVQKVAGAASIEVLFGSTTSGSVAGLTAAGQSIAPGSGVTATATAATSVVSPSNIGASSTGVAGTWTSNSLAVTGSGPTAAAGTLVGGWLSDGTSVAQILSNTAITATSGTIVVVPNTLTATIKVPTGATGIIIVPPPAQTAAAQVVTLAGAAHSSAVSGTITITPSNVSPGNGEVVVLEFGLSMSTAG